MNSCGTVAIRGTRDLQAVRPLSQLLGVKHGFACATPRQTEQNGPHAVGVPVACVSTRVHTPWRHCSGRVDFSNETKRIHAPNVHPFAGCGESRDRDPAWRTQSRASRRATFVQAFRPEERSSNNQDGIRVAHARSQTANNAPVAPVHCDAGTKCVPNRCAAFLTP